VRGGGWTPINWLKNIDPITHCRANNRKSFNREKHSMHKEIIENSYLHFSSPQNKAIEAVYQRKKNLQEKIKRDDLITVLGTLDIFILIRIRIRRSIPLTNGSGFRSGYFI
jgi:hypothetical protein